MSKAQSKLFKKLYDTCLEVRYGVSARTEKINWHKLSFLPFISVQTEFQLRNLKRILSIRFQLESSVFIELFRIRSCIGAGVVINPDPRTGSSAG